MIEYIIISILLLIILAYVCAAVYVRRNKVSFEKFYQVSNLPLMTFTNPVLGEVTLLIDTGSNTTYINKKVVDPYVVEYPEVNPEDNSIAGAGTIENLGWTSLQLTSKYATKPVLFAIADLDNICTTLSDLCGIPVHGILGTHDITNFGLIIDFNTNTIYHGTNSVKQ